jgi:hypothetical protein
MKRMKISIEVKQIKETLRSTKSKSMRREDYNLCLELLNTISARHNILLDKLKELRLK